MLPITLIVIAKYEAPVIGRCLDSVRFAADKVVVDSGSIDGTPDIAASHGARVVHQDWLGFGPQRNFATSVANHDWILVLDADELQAIARNCNSTPIEHRTSGTCLWPRDSRVWQPDVGFRKCRILNQAALATDADCLIFSDGDCVPRADFVATHVAHARPGRFLSGGYFKLTDETSKRLTAEIIFNDHATRPKWLLANGTPRSAKLGKLSARGWHAMLMNAMTPTRPTWNGHNASCWRTDLLKVNGPNGPSTASSSRPRRPAAS